MRPTWHPTVSDELLTDATVGAYLRRRGVVTADASLRATELSGGVSNITIAVHGDSFDVVVKQALGRLRVADEWLATRERILNEGRALDVTGRLTPGRVPRVIDVDPDAFAMTIEHAPGTWVCWKQELLAHRIDEAVAARLGRILAAWHAGTSEPEAFPQLVGDREAFDQLRVDPFYRTVMARLPDVASDVERYAETMLATRRCLVHGDFSPKNVLIDPDGDGVWVIDLEVAHIGDPAFDLAFLLTHLTLKAIHAPSMSDGLGRCAAAFWDNYVNAAPDVVSEAPYVLGHVGCVMMARVDGKSPAEYLTAEGRETARAIGRRLAESPPASIAEAWRILESVRS